jgi:twitching motility protein PilT
MAESFNWNKVLSDETPRNPAAEEGLLIDPRNGELVQKPQLEVAQGASVAEEADRIVNAYKPEPIPASVHHVDTTKTKYDLEIDGLSDTNRDAALGNPPVGDMHIDELLRMAIERKASDIHLTVGLPPMVRLDGEIVNLPFQPLNPQDTRRLVYDTLSDDDLKKFEQTHELDFGYGVKGLARFRFNVYMQRGSVAAALRAIPTKIPSFEQLGLPPIIREIAKRSSGLILVTGPTGSGKSTTIATMIDDINSNRQGHILTIEDPIEYLHSHKKCMINQRELHSDTFSFHNALRAVLREDPDIILVGELRDLETIEAALTLAETGHLVFGTLHTRNAPATVDRVIDVFPSDQQDQIRVLLGNTLEGVVSQQLLPRLGGGRCAAIEIMIGTPAIKNLIREGKTHQMYSVIETSAQIGMQTMDKSLADLFRNGYCSYEEILMRAVDKEALSRLAKGA